MFSSLGQSGHKNSDYAMIVYYQSMPNMQQSNAEYAASNAKYAAHLELGAQLALGVHS